MKTTFCLFSFLVFFLISCSKDKVSSLYPSTEKDSLSDSTYYETEDVADSLDTINLGDMYYPKDSIQ